MSARSELQERIVSFLTQHQNVFNAPYGIIPELKPVRRGACRTITFGCCRTLDATLTIWSEANMILKSSAFTDKTFTSEQAFYDFLRSQYLGETIPEVACAICKLVTASKVSPDGAKICEFCYGDIMTIQRYNTDEDTDDDIPF